MPADIALGVNIDHVATLRQARGTRYPDPIVVALICERTGADGSTLHLREDRRHIQDSDVFTLRERLTSRMNLEMAVTEEMLAIAGEVRPQDCCLVPEHRDELTTEGGLDVAGRLPRIADACSKLASAGSRVSLFIDPDKPQLEAAREAGAPVVEIHTGAFANAGESREAGSELQRIVAAAEYGASLGLAIHAGHGLHYGNVKPVAAIPEVVELNIGHAIIARSVFIGLDLAVREMKGLMVEARGT